MKQKLIKKWRLFLLRTFKKQYLDMMRKNGFIWGKEPTVDHLYKFYFE